MTYRANVQMIVLAGLIAAGGSMAQARGGDRFTAIDADGDGQVTSAELSAHAAARFAETDADSDGFLTPEEMLNARSGKRAEQMLKRHDTDGNGVLDAAELEAASKGRHAKRAKRMMERLDTNSDGKLALAEMTEKRDPAKIIERLDSNGDGTLSAEEFAKMRDHRGKRHGKKSDD